MSFRNLSLYLFLAVGIFVASCKRDERATLTGPVARPGAGVLSLLFTYSSEKATWVKAATDDFNRRAVEDGSGNVIRVTLEEKGSSECLDELIDGTSKAHLTSPASSAFIRLGNAKWKAKTGQDLISHEESLVRSPVVIAMWKPMAEALGWGKQPVGWADIRDLAAAPEGWTTRGLPGWGPLLFAHTHPQFSNTGLISLLSEVSAATGRPSGLTVADVQQPEVAEYLRKIERSIVHYGSSTGYLGRKMFAYGPGFLSAAVLYESTVIESYAQATPLTFPVVAIYPKEGTIWSDHPAGIVDAEWVTPEHRDAARKYLDFLLAQEWQQKAVLLGFRPGRVDVPLTAPLDAAHGVNPQEPSTTIEVPSAEVIDAMTTLWKQNKKHANLTLVMDVSDSMNLKGRLDAARTSAQEFLKKLDDADVFRLIPFNSKVLPSAPAAPMGTIREQAIEAVGALTAEGGTALYDAIDAAFQDQLARHDQEKDKISAIIVLTRAADADSKLALPALLERIRINNEQHPAIGVFGISYDSATQGDVLKQIGDATHATYFGGEPKDLREIFETYSEFF